MYFIGHTALPGQMTSCWARFSFLAGRPAIPNPLLYSVLQALETQDAYNIKCISLSAAQSWTASNVRTRYWSSDAAVNIRQHFKNCKIPLKLSRSSSDRFLLHAVSHSTLCGFHCFVTGLQAYITFDNGSFMACTSHQKDPKQLLLNRTG